MTLLHKDFNFDISRAKIVFPSNNKYFKDIPVEVNSSEKDSNLNECKADASLQGVGVRLDDSFVLFGNHSITERLSLREDNIVKSEENILFQGLNSWTIIQLVPTRESESSLCLFSEDRGTEVKRELSDWTMVGRSLKKPVSVKNVRLWRQQAVFACDRASKSPAALLECPFSRAGGC
ncbi:hypothetical protein HZH68_005395 [Vespula germanica]|uniref:Uncharacterized protein n=1 Tax=Vespula germanica TaxID=30212 RepID=A0A834KFW3_VESGE|nr:hypothetical protein HZH68_005395 [Vespula germanica]